MEIVALVSDLIFGSKLTATAAALGLPLRVVRTREALEAALADACGVIVDLNVETCDALALACDLKRQHPALRVIGFLSHVQVELARQARAGGLDDVLARSAFTDRLPAILKRLASP